MTTAATDYETICLRGIAAMIASRAFERGATYADLAVHEFTASDLDVLRIQGHGQLPDMSFDTLRAAVLREIRAFPERQAALDAGVSP